MPPPTNIHHYLPPAKLYPPPIKMYPPLPTISQNISTTTHNHPPPPTPSQSISNTTHHHQTWAKIYPPLSTTTHWKSNISTTTNRNPKYIQVRRCLTVCSHHVTYAFQGESTLYICLKIKYLLVQSRCKIWSLSDYNGTRTHNHLVCKWTKLLWVRVPLQSLKW